MKKTGESAEKIDKYVAWIEVKRLNYEERLDQQCFFSLEQRRWSSDMTEMYTIMRDIQ